MVRLFKLSLVVGLFAVESYAVEANKAVTVNVDNFVRAESDVYMANLVKDAGVGKLHHQRAMAPVDKQAVVRMNRDTLYSNGVFDLEAGPVTVILPETESRYMSVADINQDHYTSKVNHAPGKYTYTKENSGTRYIALIVRTLANPNSADDLKIANSLQDKIKIEQNTRGTFSIPQYDMASLKKVRTVIKELGTVKGDFQNAFGTKSQVDPIGHLIGAAAGWGGLPKEESMYLSFSPKDPSGKTAYRLMVGDVPVDGFWSISVYNAQGYFQKNKANAYTLNNLTAKKSDDGMTTIQFGECTQAVQNCLPIMRGWNYTVRMYRPQDPLLKGEWKFPEAEPLHQSKKLSQAD